MDIRAILIFGIPTILVTLIFGFMPWGLITAVATPICLTLFAGLFPKKRYIRINMNIALEALSYGYLDDAKDHISIAIREAESAKNIKRAEVDELREICEKVADALDGSGQDEIAKTLRERCLNLP